MQIGIVGLPLAGKTTLFATLLSQRAAPLRSGGRQEVERGIVRVPDPRLDELTTLFSPRSTVYATVEYLKVAGLEGQPEQSAGLPAAFLNNIKSVDAIALVVRAFENDAAPHPLGRINPRSDIEFVQTEFVLSDLLIIENRIERLKKTLLKTRNEKDQRELAILEKCQTELNEGHLLREMEFDAETALILRGFQFLTAKPIIFIINIGEGQLAQRAEISAQFENYQTRGSRVIVLSAQVEKEISELEPADRMMFLQDAGITEPALNLLIRQCYELLGLITFFTVGEDECRSWAIPRGCTARQAAGAIHSDLERGFIRADVVAYHDFIHARSLAACRAGGIMRLEGKEYRVQDGDILEIRFNI